MGTSDFFLSPYLLWCLSCVFLEITAEETGVGEVVFPCNLLDALLAEMELHLQLEDDILVNDGLGSMGSDLAHDIGKVFGRYIHQGSIVIDIP